MKRKRNLMISLVFVLLMAVGIGIYGRKMSVKNLFGGFDWTNCDRMKVSIYMKDGGVQEHMIEKEDQAFKEIMDLFVEKEFRKSLKNGSLNQIQYAAGDDDSRWWIDFVYDEPVESFDGSTHSGELLEFSNFCGSMKFDLRYKDEDYYVTTDNQESWLEEMTRILMEINQG